MPDEINLEAVRATVVWGAFALSLLFGAIVSRTHFCTMGAIADIVGTGNWDRMRMWALAIATAIVGTGVLAGLGLIDTGKTVYTAPRLLWLSSLLGGFVFGVGMVLASGCGSKTLIRVGQGNLKSVVVLLVMALVAYMTMRGILAVGRVASVDRVAIDLAGPQDLGALISRGWGVGLAHARLGTALVLGGALALWVLLPRAFRASGIKADIVLGGLAVGAIIVALWYLSGHLGYIAEDPQTLEERFVATNSGRMESLTFTAPPAYALELLILWSDKSLHVTLAVAAVAGVISGSLLYALATRTFRWEGFRGIEDTANHLIGAALMGAGGVTALGCTIGQGLSGVSTLALGSFIALGGIVAGGVAATRYQIWRLERAE